MIQFIKSERLETGHIYVRYKVSAQIPGTGASVQEDLILVVSTDNTKEPVSATIHLEGAKGATPQEAIARLARWLRALADELEKQRPIAHAIPLFNDP